LSDSPIKFPPHLIACLALALALAAPVVRADDTEFFEKKIRPVLAEHCYKCHSAQSKKVKGGLLLDTREGIVKGGDEGALFVPGDPDKSRLIEAVRYKNEKLQMPPDHRLAEQQIADLIEWVKRGAPLPAPAVAAAGSPTSPATVGPPAKTIDYARARKAWAFQRPQLPPVPPVKRTDWAVSDLDRFILARLEAKNVPPAPPADKRALIRRATFDLTGLPPTPQDVEAFVADQSTDAFAKVVDRLLASPAYGERWARHWLDVVRYTDSLDARGSGTEGDISEAWRYRDWVVGAFNRDLPYDQFVKNQIAGDLIPAPQPGKMNVDGVVATGVYVIGEWGTGDADKEKMLTDIVDDQVDVTGRAFLGLTLACARCHDHKFDPITTQDYYGLAGIFFSSHIIPDPGVKTAGSPVLRIPLVGPDEVKAREEKKARLAELEKESDKLLDEHLAALGKQLLPQLDKYLLAAFDYSHRPAAEAPLSVADFAAARNLNPYALRQWVNLTGSGPLALLTTPLDAVDGNTNLKALRPAGDGKKDTPNVVVNTAVQPINFKTITVPGRGLAVHPSPNSGVAIGWKSPISGPVRVTGKLMDADVTCGNGITWGLGLRLPGGGTIELATGGFENGGSQDVVMGRATSDRLASLRVEAGQMLQLAVLPKGDYACDTTVVELEIREVAGEQRVWSLSRDVVPDLLATGSGAGAKGNANPHADKSGAPDVWHFYDLGEGAAPAGFGSDSVIANWFRASAAASGAEGADLTAAKAKLQGPANAVKAVMVAISSAVDKLSAAGKEAKTLTGSNADLYRTLTDPRGTFWAAARGDASLFTGPLKDKVAALTTEQAALKQALAQAAPVAHGFQEGGTPKTPYEGFHDARVHVRGRYDRLADLVPRHFPTIVAGDQQPAISQGSGRMQLAQWIASADNPLTARVMVNRIWQHHFGEGIVRTPNNYGKLGTPPTHPELLDWLAIQFVKSGWSMKAMHRLMMLSATYQQSSVPDPATLKADPENLLLGRMNRRRLDAEELRDELLSATDKLDRTLGGKAIKELDTPRRTLYVMTIRSDRSNYRALFDAADPAAIVEKRIESTVAPQSLFLLNSSFALMQTKALAELALKQPNLDDAGRIDWLYARLYARQAKPEEKALGLQVVREAQAGADAAAAWEQYCQVLLCANEFIYVD